MADNGTLSCKKHRFLQALLQAKSIREAAGLTHISERTAWRWLRDPTFRAELRRAQDEALGQATRQAVGTLGEALETLRDVMARPSAPASARVAAARAVLEVGLRLAETLDLAERVAALEERVDAGDVAQTD